MTTNNPFSTIRPAATPLTVDPNVAPQMAQAAPQMVAPQMVQAAPQMVVPQMVQAAPQVAPQMVAPQVAPQMVSPQVAPGVVPVPGVDGGTGKVKRPRKTPNRQMTKEERLYVINNYAVKATGQIAAELNLTRQQVYRTVHETRHKIKARIEAAQLAGDTATAQKWQSYVITKLPEKDFNTGGGRAKGGAIDSIIDSLLD